MECNIGDFLQALVLLVFLILYELQPWEQQALVLLVFLILYELQPWEQQICRVCMADCETEIIPNKLECSFIDITGLQTFQDLLKDDLPIALCVGCQNEFSKCLTFRDSTQKTNATLCELKKNGKLTRDNIKELTSVARNNIDIEFCDFGFGVSPELDANVKLEKCDDDDFLVKIETLESSKEIKKIEEPVSNLKNIFVSDNLNSARDKSDNDQPCESESSSDDRPLLTKPSTKTSKTRKKAVQTIDKRKKRKKTAKKNHTSQDPTSTSFDLFSYLLKHFEFSMLSRTQQRIEFEKRLSDESFKRRKYKCEFCYRGFKFKETYDRHIDQKHAKHPTRPHKCDLCSTYFTTKKYLKEHLLLHSESFKCKLCDYVTEKRNAAKLHISWHEGKVYKCKHCPQTFKRQTTLFNHNRTSHAAECVCADCGFSFASQRGLRCHRKLRHAHTDRNKMAEDGPLCEDCNIQFASESALDIHRKVSPKHSTVGNRLRNDASAIKPKEFYDEVESVSKLDAKTHVIDPNNAIRRRGQLRNQSVECEKCGEPQPSFFAYRKHFSNTHPGEIRTLYPATSSRVLCDHCGKVFVSKAYLREHMNTHTKATILSCADCDKCFYSRITYLVHRQTHLGVKYPCKLCSKTFTKCSNRDRHVAYVHSDVKNIKCNFCDKYFKSPKEQKGHIDHVHFKKPWPKRVRNRDANRITDRSERD